MTTYDVVIVGSGVVGATTALLLSENPHLKIAVLESSAITSDWQQGDYHFRVSAISKASQQLFEKVKAWPSIAEKRISPYTNMHVWDASGSGEIHFDCRDVGEAALGFIVEDNLMRASLIEKIQEKENIDLLFPCKLMSFKEENAAIEIIVENREPVFCKLLIAADGANSMVRALAGIELKTHDYEHTAIVATLQTELSHQRTAWQRFLPTGPLAFLHLENVNTCSIVWSTSHEHANELMAKAEDDFCEQLAEAFEKKIGAVKLLSKRYHFPLRMRHAKHYVKNRLALIGDAAHTIHPLAGQGVNLGLLDAACLAETILDACKKGRNFSSYATLRRYERFRKSDNLAMLAGVDALKRLFASENSLLKALRNTGLSATNHAGFLKNWLINYAQGLR